MMLLATLVGIASVGFYLIRVGGRLRDAKLSDEAIRDIQKVYKLEKQEDQAIRDRLDGNRVDSDSIASIFPDELHGIEEKRRGGEGIRQANSTKD